MVNYQATAYYVKNALNLDKIKQRNKQHALLNKERNMLLYRLNEHKFIGVFSFGAVAILGVDDDAERISLISEFIGQEGIDWSITCKSDDSCELEPEIYDIRLDTGNSEAVLFDYIRLRDLTPDKIIVIFQVLAQSVAIDFLETELDWTIHRFEKVHSGLERRGKLVMGNREVMRIIGRSGNIVNFIIDKLALLDKPDVTWEEEEAQRLHSNLRKILELDDRFSALRFKLEFVQDSSRLVMDALDNRKAAQLEWIIIILIAAEFIFFIFAEII